MVKCSILVPGVACSNFHAGSNTFWSWQNHMTQSPWVIGVLISVFYEEYLALESNKSTNLSTLTPILYVRPKILCTVQKTTVSLAVVLLVLYYYYL